MKKRLYDMDEKIITYKENHDEKPDDGLMKRMEALSAGKIVVKNEQVRSPADFSGEPKFFLSSNTSDITDMNVINEK